MNGGLKSAPIETVMQLRTITLAVLTLASIAAAAPAPAAAAKAKKPPLTAEQRSAQSILKSLSLRDRVAQMVIGVAYGDAPGTKSAEYEKFRHWVRDLKIGGLIVNNRVQNGLARNAEPHTMALFLNQMQRLAKTPLIVGGDFERGASMRVSDTTKFPHSMAYAAARDVEASRYEGLMTAREARAIGVQWIFAPVSDVNNNPENPVINIRSFGEDPEQVAAHVAAYIEGAHSDQKNPVLVSAKHFPGHGDTNTDSHLDLARLEAGKDRMDTMELIPFRAAIAHGVDSIMTAHMTVPAIEPDEIPATVSRKVLTGLLREELGFNGLVVTDAMDMLGLAKQFSSGEASVRAIEAGADVLLMPPDPDAAIRAVLSAIERGRISKQRIDQSAARVLEAKVRVGLFKKKLVDLDAISDALDTPDDADRAQSLADRAVTLVRNVGDVVPLAARDQACVVASVGVRMSSFGQRMIDEFRRRAPKAKLVFVDNTMPGPALEAMVGDTSRCPAIVFATFTTNTTLNGDIGPFVQKLTDGTVPVVFVTFGNPYLLKDFPRVAAYIATFSPTPPAETAVVKALFGEIAITGKLPVSIPGFAQYGDGIQLPKK
jgi:beta-N-acetylhexosaminidase